MRRVFRIALSEGSSRSLDERQARADASHQQRTLDIEHTWQTARRTKPLKEALRVLCSMAGPRERCMYCGDSHGTDIEHFWPKADYPQRMFSWPNMLLGCAECNRLKSNTFPLIDGAPGLIDISAENPWDFLDFDPVTGNIAPRYSATGEPFIKGEHTTSIFHLDRREALARGYRKTFLRLCRVVQQMLEAPEQQSYAIIGELLEEDDHGLLGWCFEGTGYLVAPFCDLREQYPALWQACFEAYRQSQNLPQV
ncbi:hypothetical protein F8S13_07515 [Chloroflexia bacterium SDU3-3]|nr:hypothetical protein F8S13_07515 [Chloroflexia bacterium SDU3-3]